MLIIKEAGKLTPYGVNFLLELLTMVVFEQSIVSSDNMSKNVFIKKNCFSITNINKLMKSNYLVLFILKLFFCNKKSTTNM